MENNNSTYIVDTKTRAMPDVEINYPISPRENLIRMLNKKPPLYMPNMNTDIAISLCPSAIERPPRGQSGLDWFGVDWTWVDSVGGATVTPGTFLLEDMCQWEKKLHFPDLDSIDFSQGKDKVMESYREDKCCAYLLHNGLLERSLSLCDTTNVFVWLATEPESVTRFFEKLMDFRIKLIDKLIEQWITFDIVFNSDDWGHSTGAFISPNMYREFFFPQMKRFVDAMHERGKLVNFHSCGKIGVLLSQIAQIAPDMLEPQAINDLVSLKSKYGKSLPIQVAMDPLITQRPGVTDREIVSYIHNYVDTYYDGFSVASYRPRDEHVNELIIRELFEYSYKKSSIL